MCSFFDHLLNSTRVAVVALANSLWSDFISIKLSQIGSFHYLLVLATECFFSFDNFEIPRDAFSGGLMRCGRADGSWEY